MAYIADSDVINTTTGTVQITGKTFGSKIVSRRLGYDPVANYSKMKFEIYTTVTNTGYEYEGQCYDTFIRVDWTTYSKAQFYIYCNPWPASKEVLVHSVELNLYHDTNGNKTVNLWGRFRTGTTYGPGDCYVASSGSAFNVVLPQLDRVAPAFTAHTINDVTTSSVVVAWTCDKACDALQYSLDGGAWVSATYGATYTVSGLNPNTSHTIKTRARRTYNQVWGESGTLNFQTDPNTVQIQSVSISNLTPFSVKMDVTLQTPANTDQLYFAVQNAAGTNTIQEFYSTGISPLYHTFENLTPSTGYKLAWRVRTVRSGVWSTWVYADIVTPADAYVRIIEADGTTSEKKKMYLIASDGTTTEVKKENVALL